MASTLPRNLALIVQRLFNFNRTTIRVRPQSNDAVEAGQTISFRMPSNTIVDLANLHFFGECEITNEGVQATTLDEDGNRVPKTFNYMPAMGLPERMNETIERLDVVINGQVITLSNSDYGALDALLFRLLCTQNSGYNESEVHIPNIPEIQRGGPRGNVSSIPSRVAIADSGIEDSYQYTQSEKYGNNTQLGRVFPFTITGLLGFLSGHYVRFIDTAVTGPMEIRIRLAPPSIMWRGVEDTARLDTDGSVIDPDPLGRGVTSYGTLGYPDLTTGNYMFKHMYMGLDTIGFPDDFYRAILANRLASGGIITVPYQNFYSINKSISSSDSLSFNIATQSLDYLIATFRDIGYSRARVKQFSLEARDSNYYKFVSARNKRDRFYGSSTTYQFMVNNLMAPTWPVNVDEARIVSMMALDQSGQIANVGLNKLDSEYQNGSFAFVQSFRHHSEGEKIISGLDTRGAASNMEFMVHDPDVQTAYDRIDPVRSWDKAKLMCMIWAACTSSLEISAGQNVQVIF